MKFSTQLWRHNLHFNWRVALHFRCSQTRSLIWLEFGIERYLGLFVSIIQSVDNFRRSQALPDKVVAMVTPGIKYNFFDAQ